MNQIANSDLTSKMLASRSFDSIVGQILSSNLNFQIQISPFSANIALKKSQVKDKSGTPILAAPPTTSPSLPTVYSADIEELHAKNVKLEKDLINLRSENENVDRDREAAYHRLKYLESESTSKSEQNDDLKKELVKKNDLANALKLELSCLAEAHEEVKDTIENQQKDIHFLEKAVKQANKISENLNQKLNSTRVKFNEEKENMIKSHKAEVKAWRDDLGEETKQKTKLMKKLRKFNEAPISLLALPPPLDDVNTLIEPIPNSTFKNIFCSVCAVIILNYTPVYFLGETVNPACDDCKDTDDDQSDYIITEDISLKLDQTYPITPKGFNCRRTRTRKPLPPSTDCSHNEQCVIRQPFPPPLLALMPIVNLHSNYHERTLAGELDWGSTCSYCMHIEYEKYGCDSCVWIKSFGELHGYPDLDPYYFKKHL